MSISNHSRNWTKLLMPDTVVCWVEQLAMRDSQPAAFNFTYGMGIVVGYLLNDPGNEVENEIRDIIFEGVTAQDEVQQTEDNKDDTKNDDSHNKDEAGYVCDRNNNLGNTYEGVLTTEPTVGVKKI